jgi:hypothetical protein
MPGRRQTWAAPDKRSSVRSRVDRPITPRCNFDYTARAGIALRDEGLAGLEPLRPRGGQLWRQDAAGGDASSVRHGGRQFVRAGRMAPTRTGVLAHQAALMTAARLQLALQQLQDEAGFAQVVTSNRAVPIGLLKPNSGGLQHVHRTASEPNLPHDHGHAWDRQICSPFPIQSTQYENVIPLVGFHRRRTIWTFSRGRFPFGDSGQSSVPWHGQAEQVTEWPPVAALHHRQGPRRRGRPLLRRHPRGTGYVFARDEAAVAARAEPRLRRHHQPAAAGSPVQPRPCARRFGAARRSRACGTCHGGDHR